MKILLITFNLVLSAILVWGGVKFFRNIRSSGTEAGFTVKKRTQGTVKAKKEPPPAKSSANEKETVLPLSAQVENIIKTNIFNQERCPNSGTFGNTRVELTLVGTFKVGKASGAIILQKTQNRNMPFMPIGMNGFQGIPQRQMGIGQRNAGGNSGSPQQGTVNTRRQIGGSRGIQASRNATGVASGTSTNTTQQKTYKQYVRLGETLSNGYKLVEVSRTRAVLTRGSDKLELELADASKNAPQSSSSRRTSSANQTQVMQQMLNSMQQMQRMQMMQGFQMMRMGQQGGSPEQQSQNSRRSGTSVRTRR